MPTRIEFPDDPSTVWTQATLEQLIAVPNNHNNFILGTSQADTLDGLSGNDNLSGLAGDDVLSGGLGNDDVKGGDGADTLYGGDGMDHLWGDEGEDVLHGGGPGNGLYAEDSLMGGAGNDRLYAEGRAYLSGGSGNDEFHIGAFVGTLTADAAMMCFSSSALRARSITITTSTVTRVPTTVCLRRRRSIVCTWGLAFCQISFVCGWMA